MVLDWFWKHVPNHHEKTMPPLANSGLYGPILSPDEKAFFRDANPWGFILFRNIGTHSGSSRRSC